MTAMGAPEAAGTSNTRQMVNINVYLHSVLQKRSSRELPRRFPVSLDDGATILDLVRQLEFDIEPHDLLLALNGQVAELDQVLSEGDKVHLMLPISGGKY
ncbi:MAG: MoaD/ThiS family protein [Anaerolineales bacterium]|nr:MoaD/ThiS family protein [Anaerolineales bacterium]